MLWLAGVRKLKGEFSYSSVGSQLKLNNQETAVKASYLKALVVAAISGREQ